MRKLYDIFGKYRSLGLRIVKMTEGHGQEDKGERELNGEETFIIAKVAEFQ